MARPKTIVASRPLVALGGDAASQHQAINWSDPCYPQRTGASYLLIIGETQGKGQPLWRGFIHRTQPTRPWSVGIYHQLIRRHLLRLQVPRQDISETRIQDLLTISMEDLRNAHGAGRLGEHVRTNISKALKGLGLAHYPAELPNYQWDMVRIYKLGTPAADLVDAVLAPSKEHDDEIRQAVSGEAAAVIARIRELVCN